jgi:hypothetical protein
MYIYQNILAAMRGVSSSLDNGASNVPSATSCVCKENYDVDASSLDNT